ncbi:SpoIIE family protein phosphatase [Thioalkalivibrio sp. ALE11]|uniref:SpoIIE family protein phosphatase n=1 Tax=Thioalkalivibrio sp. ALE11 TaxID=1265494 RepID=UPI0003813909|nr:SpoIIE family protein phosphatase [Thioalkalivibrio sp. ALE11]
MHPPSKSLAVRLALVTVLTVAVIFFSTSGLLYYMVRGIMLDHAEDQARELTHATASRIESSLNEVAGSARTLAASLTTGAHPPEDLRPLLESVTGGSDEIQGTAVSWEPGAALPGREAFGPFVYEEGDSLEYMDLGADNGDYFTRDWYQIPALTGHDFWAEPFASAADPDRLITTFSTPFGHPGPDTEGVSNTGALAGVVTLDVELPRLTDRVDEVEILDSGFAFLLSPRTRFITWPDRDWIMRESLFSLAETLEAPELRELGRELQRSDEGFTRLPEALIDEPARLYHVRLPDPDWVVGVVIPERELFGDVLRVMHWVLIIGSTGFLVLLGAIIAISRGITRPLKGLVSSAGEIARGNLDRPLPPIRSQDEVGELARSFDEMRLSLKDYINDLTATTAAKERIESELKIARNIQMSFLPRRLDLSRMRAGVELHADLRPAREVGGDLYDFFTLDDEGRLFFAVGDVSDKGVPAALFMAVTRTLVKGIAEQEPDPGRILARVNNELCLHNENAMFVTYLCGILDLDTGVVTLANAGHNPPLHRYADGSREWLRLPPGLVLGAMEDMDYASQQVRLAPGEELLLYTDGVTEATDPQQALFGEDRLGTLYDALAGRPARDQVDAIMQSVEDFAEGTPQADDITVLALRYRAPAGEADPTGA